jgi:hypothetical protein
MQLPQMLKLQLQYPHVLAIHPINFCSIQDALTLYMDLNINLVSVQIRYKIFKNRYLYIHSFPMPIGYIHGG